METPSRPTLPRSVRPADLADLVALLTAMTPSAKISFARWCGGAGLPVPDHSAPARSPSETAATIALSSGIEDKGGALTPEIHAFFDPIYGEWKAWWAAEGVVGALANALAADDQKALDELGSALARLTSMDGFADRA